MYPYCWIHLKSKDKLQVKQSSIPNAGEGLFYVGKQSFPSNKKITDYSAKTVSTSSNPNSNYVFKVSGRKYLDAQDKDNYVGRYINSNRNTNKRPNVRFTKGTRIFNQFDRHTIPIYSKSVIQPNSELLINYGRTFQI
jgi:hypothetical protein